MFTIDDLAGVRAPFQNSDNAAARVMGRDEAQHHLDGLVDRYGLGPVERLRSGRITAKLATGEDLAYRMVRDGFAVPGTGSRDAMRKAHEGAKRQRRGLFDGHEFVATAALDLAVAGARRIIADSDTLTQ